MKGLRFALTILAVLAFIAPVTAQQQTGITGSVKDADGGVLPGVVVTAKNTGTALTRTAYTSGDGRFTIAGLPSGMYEVTASLQGFADYKLTGLKLVVGTEFPVNIVMQPAGVTQTVTVTAERTIIETTESSISNAIPEELIETLPVAERNAITLALLVPGVSAAPYFDPTKSRDNFDGFQFGAASPSENLILVDGADNNDDVVGSILQFYPQESIQEFEVVTSRFKAEYGHTDGGVVNMITKSGTNEYSGGGYWLFRHDALNSKTFVEKETGADKASFKQNVFGAFVGGPISQDKMFFFGNIDTTSRPQQILTTTGGLIPDVDSQGQVPNDFKQTLFVGKFNANVNENNFMTARYAFQDDSTVNINLTARDGLDHAGQGASTYHAFLLKNQTVIGGDKLNEVFYQLNSYENGISSNANGGDLERKELIVGDSALGHNINHPQQTLQDKHQLVNNFSWRMDASGDHDLKAGVEFQSVSVGGQFSTGQAFAQFVWGSELDYNRGELADEVTLFNGPLFYVGESKNTIWSFYIQDDWQPTDQLTLNLGLRWDIETNDWNQSSDRDPTGLGPGRTFISSDPIFFGSQPTTDKNNIAPRLGLAYDIKGDGEWVMRGGWGIYYQQIFWNSPIRNAFREGPQLGVGFTSDVTFSHTQPFCPAGNPTPGCIPVPAQPSPNAADFVGGSFTGTVPSLDTPRTQHFSIGVSTLLSDGWGLDVDYLHTRSSNQIYRTRRAMNSSVNGFDVENFGQRASINAQGAKQEYNGLLMSVRGRVEDITTQISYTYGRGKGHVPRQTSRVRVDAEDQFDRNFGPHESSRNHLFAASLFYQLPHDFQIGSIFKFQSGFHFTGLDPTQPDLDGDGTTSDEIAGMGTRSEYTGDSFSQIDLRVSKTFQVGSLRPQVFFEIFNLFNTRNEKFESVVNTVGNPDFGTSLAVAGQGRQGQLSLRLDF